VEMGSKNVLKFLMAKNTGDIQVYLLNKANDLETLKQGLMVSEKEYLPIIAGCLGIAVSTRNRNLSLEGNEYEKRVVRPYREIEVLVEKLESNGTRPTVNHVKKALQLLQELLTAKKVPALEQEDRLDKLVKKKILKM
jgi:[acyl-carrier-protein] S-malonyltransferase